LSDFDDTWIFSIDFSKTPQISNFMKIRPVGAELFHAGGRTDSRADMTKLIVTFRNFAHAPDKLNLMSTWIRHPTACDRLCILTSTASFPGHLCFTRLFHLCNGGGSVKIFTATLSSSKSKCFGRLVAPAVVWVWALIPTSRDSCGSPAGGRRGRSGSISVCSRQRFVLIIRPRGKHLTNFYTIYKIHLLLFFAMVFWILSFVYILKNREIGTKVIVVPGFT